MTDPTRPDGNGESHPIDDSGLPAGRPRGIGRRILGGVVSLGLVVLIFAFLIPKMTTASLSETLSEITAANVVVAALLGLLHLFANWTQISASLPGLRIRQAAVSNLSSAAVSNSLPEGGAVGTALTYAIYHSWGFGVGAATSSILATGVFGQLIRYGLLGLALVVLTLTSGAAKLGLALLVLVLVAAAAFIIFRIISSEAFARRFGHVLDHLVHPLQRLLHKQPSDLAASMDRFRGQLSGLVRIRWRQLTLTTLFGEVTAVLILGVCLRMLGIDQSEASWALVFTAYGGMSLVNTVSPTPGGVGTAEAALIAILGTSVPDAQDAQMTAAIMLYRGATWLMPILLGIPAYLFWRFNTSWRKPVPQDEAAAAG